MFSDKELLACLHAGAPSSLRCDFPDPVGWDDLVFTPDRTLAVIRQRLANGLSPARTEQMPLPKYPSDDHRIMTVADPYDEVIYRTIVGRLARTIDSHLGTEVLSYRLEDPAKDGVGWRIRDFGYTQDLRRHMAEIRMVDIFFGGLGTLDIRNYYPSIHVPQLETTLLAIGCRDADVRALNDWLVGLQRVWGVPGVPTGPETSGILGNAYLIPVDKILRGLFPMVEFQRYTDDFHLWVVGEGSFIQIKQLVGEVSKALGLQLNPRKVKFAGDVASAERLVFDDQLDHLDRLRGKAKLSAAKVLFDHEIDNGSPSGKRVKYCIGVFRGHHDPHGAYAAQRDNAIMRSCPRAWGSYLGTLHGSKKIDPDWLAEAALGEISLGTAAVRTHLLLACGKGHHSASDGERFCELATSRDQRWIALRCAAAEAWAASDRWKPTRASEAALAVGDGQRRRALALTMRFAPIDNKCRHALAKLKSAEPVCGPAAIWIEEGGHRTRRRQRRS